MCANVTYEHSSVQIYVMYWQFIIQMGTNLFKKEALFTNNLSSTNNLILRKSKSALDLY